MSSASTGPLYGRTRGGWGDQALRAWLGGTDRVEAMERYGALTARALMSQIFLLSGVMKVLDPAGTADQMAARGMFWIPFSSSRPPRLNCCAAWRCSSATRLGWGRWS